VVTARELATEIRIRKGVRDPDPQRADALALAVVRATVEAEAWPHDKSDEDQPRLTILRRGSRVLIACESLPGTDDPSAPDLADYAKLLGQQADRLAAADPLPGRATVLRDLRSVQLPAGMAPLADTRLVALASAVAQDALYSPRLELYPRGLSLARSIRISQAAAGVRHERGTTVEELLSKVRLRFPDLDLGDPTAVEMEEALREAGFKLELDNETHLFSAPMPDSSRILTTSATSTGTFSDPVTVATAAASAGRDPRALLGAKLADAKLRGGFLALSLRGRYLQGAAEAISAAYGVEPVPLSGLFLSEFRALAAEQGTDWGKVLTIDARFTASGALSTGLRSYVKATWARVAMQLQEQLATMTPETVLFLHDASLAARYHDAGGHDLLVSLQNAARREDDAPYGLWLLCPSESPHETPHLDGQIVEVLGEAERAVLRGDYLAQLTQGAAGVA
jgi:hypothetical protein